MNFKSILAALLLLGLGLTNAQAFVLIPTTNSFVVTNADGHLSTNLVVAMILPAKYLKHSSRAPTQANPSLLFEAKMEWNDWRNYAKHAISDPVECEGEVAIAFMLCILLLAVLSFLIVVKLQIRFKQRRLNQQLVHWQEHQLRPAH